MFTHSYYYLLLYTFCSVYSVSSCWCVNVYYTAATGYQPIQQIYHIIIFIIKTDTVTYYVGHHHHNHHHQQEAKSHPRCNFLCIGPPLFLRRLTIFLTAAMYSHINSGRRVPFFLNKCYPLTSILTPWCRVLLEKLTGLQLVKKFPAFHGARRFITVLTSVRQLSLSWASPNQSIYPHPTSWRSILILSTHLCLGLPSGLFPSGFPTKTLYAPSPHTYAPHTQPISFFSMLSPA